MRTGVRLCVWGPLGIALLAASATAGEAQAGNDAAAGKVTPLEWLRSLPKPASKEGHTLPPLTRWGWANEYYYHDFNSGWIGKGDMLSAALGAKGYELRFGMRNSYDYVCPGYKQDDNAATPPVWDASQPIGNDAKAFGDLRLYEGFLKCLYTEGMIGAVAGYFSYPKGGFDTAFAPEKPPQFLMQMVILGRVHAQFSHLEKYLREGELQPGPNQHAKVTDQPAYEFPTGKPNWRVLARKMPKEPKWLITAWAADGIEGTANVEIPELGSVAVQARATGSIYEATMKDGKQSLVPAGGETKP